MADRPKGYGTRATTILAVLIVTGVISPFGIASSLASTLRTSASGNLRSCGSFAERHGSNTVPFFEHNVTCRNGRKLDATLERRLARRQVPGGVLNARGRGDHFYGRFGAPYRIGAFTWRFAAEGLGGDEYDLVCRASHARGRESHSDLSSRGHRAGANLLLALSPLLGLCAGSAPVVLLVVVGQFDSSSAAISRSIQMSSSARIPRRRRARRRSRRGRRSRRSQGRWQRSGDRYRTLWMHV